MLRRPIEILAAGLVLPVDQGDVAGEGQVISEIKPAAQLHPLDAGLADVLIGHHRRTPGGGPCLALDLVLDIVVEGGNPGAPERTIIGGAQLVADGGFRLQIRVAHHGAATATGGYRIVRVGLGNGRRLERLANAALDHPVVSQAVEGITAGAELGAIGLVVIDPATQGQRQIAKAKLILQIERALVDADIAPLEVDVMLEFGDAVLGTAGQQVAAQITAQLAIEGVVGLAHIAAGLAQRRHQFGVIKEIHLLEGIADPAVELIPTADVSGVEPQSLHLLDVARRLAVVVPVGLPIVFGVVHPHIQLLTIVDQPFDVGEDPQLFTLLDGISLGVDALLGLPGISVVSFHHQVGQQFVVDQRPAHIGARLVDIPAVTIGGVAEGIGGRRFGLLPGLTQDDIDHPTQRIGTVEGGDRATDHFDTLDGRHRDGGEIEIIAITGGKSIAGTDTPAIDQQQGVIPLQPAQLDLAAAVAGSRADIDPRQLFQSAGQIIDIELVELGPGHHRDAGRGGQLAVPGFTRRHHHSFMSGDRRSPLGQNWQGKKGQHQRMHCKSSG